MSHDQNRRGDGQILPHTSGEHVAPPGPDAQPAAASAQTTPPAEPPAPPPSGGPTAQEVQPQPAQGDGRPTAAGTHGGPATHVHADGRASDGATGGAPQASAPAPALPYGQTGAPPPVANISLPNLLTGIRCICVLVLALMLVWPFGGPFLTGALVIFAFAALTDWLDGQLARALNMQTDLGRMLDHMADKLLVCVTLLSMCAAGLLDGLNAFAAALIVAREIFISGLREHLSGRGVVVPPSMAGKWKATFQMVAIAGILAAPLAPFEIVARISALLILWLALALTLVSALQYVMDTREEWQK